jgi:general secretion pathway protein J
LSGNPIPPCDIWERCKPVKRTIRRDTRGFTLLEILIAMAILSIVLGALYSAFFMAHRALAGMDQSLIQLQESRALVDTLKREIESALYSKESAYIVFKMEDRDFYGRQMSGIIMTSFSPHVKGLAKIIYRVEEKNGRLMITKSATSAFSHGAEDRPVELLGDIESFMLEARYNDTWVKTWDSALSENAPEEVRITLMIRAKKETGETSPAAPFTLFDTATLRVGKLL